jgi:hypothetical protein
MEILFVYDLVMSWSAYLNKDTTLIQKDRP